MADFRKLEMAADHRSFLGGVRVLREHRRFRGGRYVRFLVTAVLVSTAITLVMFGACFWSQRRLELENGALRESVLALESRLETVQMELTKAKGKIEGSSSDRESELDLQLIHRRLRRSVKNGDNKHKKNSPRAVHFQYDVDSSDSTQLKWRVYSAADSGSTRTKRNEPKYQLTNSVHLSGDRTSVTIDEGGLYFLYAQIHFENARPRNAFAVKVDDTSIMKCFQSLDYFNKSLTAIDNSRFKPCYSASSVVLRPKQVVSVVNLYSQHRIYNDPLATFWGLIKLAD